MNKFKAITINAFNGDPIEMLSFDFGTQFIAGQLLATNDGVAMITEIQPDEDYGCLIQLMLDYQYDYEAKNYGSN